MLSTLLGFWLVVYGLQYGMVVLPPGVDGRYVYGTAEQCEKAAQALVAADPYLRHVCVPDTYEAEHD